ncbi:MAG: tetratricopeptide repeat protein [Myxococcales bacterium]|nr:tetratricopeptide repeat protein [Myxococcales bacterium]
MAPPARNRLLVLLVVALAWGCTPAEERFAEHVARADEFAQRGEIREALLEYRSALKIQPQDAEINYRIAELALGEFALADAAFFYHEAYRLDPDRIDAAMKEARLLLFSDPERANEIIEEGLLKAPDHPLVHVTRSERALTQIDTREALAAALTAVELDASDPAIWMQVGRVHQARIREARLIDKTVPTDAIFESAIAAYEKADELAEGGSVPARLERARSYATWTGHGAEAASAYQAGVELAQEKGDSVQILAAAAATEAYARSVKDIPLRRWALRRIVDTEDRMLESWGTLATLAEGQKGQTGGGEAVLLELLEKRPDDPQAHMLYANFLVRVGRAADAVAHLQDRLENGLDSPLAWEQLLRIQINRRQLSDARAAFVRMSDEFPDHPLTERAEARLALAERRPAAAVEILHTLVGNDDSYETQRLLALTEHRLGNLPAAVAAIDRALTLKGDFDAEGFRLKAAIHHDAEDWGITLRVLRTLLGRGVVLTHDERLMRARCLYKVRQFRAGREVLESLLAEPDAPVAAAVEYARFQSQRTPERARAYLLKAYNENPRSYDVLESLGALDIQTGRAEQALERLNDVIANRRAGPKILMLRANLLARMGALDRAEADALRAFEASPRLPGAVNLLFAIYRAQGRLEEARRSFEQAEAAGVLHIGARQLLARLYMVHGETAKAREMLEKVLAENRDMPAAKNDLAFMLAEDGVDLDRALVLAKDAQRSLSEEPATADTVGYVYYRKGLYAAALQQFRYAIDLARRSAGGELNEPGIHYHMGLTLYAMGRNEQAARAFRKSLEIDPDFSEADDARRLLETVSPSDAERASPS